MKIICVGKNYPSDTPPPSVPLIFLKPDSATLPKDHPFFLPEFSRDVTLEVELAVRICRLGKYISARFAHKYYDAFTAAVDFTAVDILDDASEKGMPWELSKGFDGSAVIGNWVEKDKCGSWDALTFSMEKSSQGMQQEVQRGYARDMIFHIDKIIEYVSRYYTLKIGDVILTGAPSPALPAVKDDVFHGFIGSEKVFELKIK